VLTVYYGQWHQEDEPHPDGPPVWGQFLNQHHPTRGAGTRCSDCLIVEQVCRLTIAGVPTFAAIGRMNGWTRYEEVFAVVPIGVDSLLYLKVRSQPLLPVALALSAFASIHRTPLPH
jgi:hypothetical protein